MALSVPGRDCATPVFTRCQTTEWPSDMCLFFGDFHVCRSIHPLDAGAEIAAVRTHLSTSGVSADGSNGKPAALGLWLRRRGVQWPQNSAAEACDEDSRSDAPHERHCRQKKGEISTEPPRGRSGACGKCGPRLGKCGSLGMWMEVSSFLK